MNKKYLLFLLLALIILLGVLVLKEDTVETFEYSVESDMYIYAISSPVPIQSQVLGSSTDKVAYNANLSDKKYYDLISQYSWNHNTAYNILLCESGGNPEAHNYNSRTKDNSWGLFQVNLYGNLANKRPTAEWLKIPENNVAYAYELYLEREWRPWTNCYKKIEGN